MDLAVVRVESECFRKKCKPLKQNLLTPLSSKIICISLVVESSEIKNIMANPGVSIGYYVT